MEDAIAMIVDGNDRIVEVVPTKVDLSDFAERGVLTLESITIDIPKWDGEGLSHWIPGKWRVIYELPIGCFEIDIPNMKSGDTLAITVGDPRGTTTIRECTNKPALAEPVTEIHHADR